MLSVTQQGAARDAASIHFGPSITRTHVVVYSCFGCINSVNNDVSDCVVTVYKQIHIALIFIFLAQGSHKSLNVPEFFSLIFNT